MVAGPHDQIHQRDLTNRHDLIFAIVQLKHLPFLAGQVLQCPQHLTLFTAVALLLAPILVLSGLDSVDTLPQLLQFGINRGFALASALCARDDRLTLVPLGQTYAR